MIRLTILYKKEDKRESVLSEDQQKEVEALFKEIMETQKGGHVELKALSPDDYPVMITKPEFMQDERDADDAGHG